MNEELEKLNSLNTGNIVYVYKEYWDEIQKKIKTLEIIKENIGLKISADEDIGCLYVPITKCFQPLGQNIVIVGYVKGNDKIDLLKEILL